MLRHSSLVHPLSPCLLLAALLAPAWAARGAHAAQTGQGPTMTAALEASQIYAPDAWQPVRLQFSNDTDRAIDGAAVVTTGPSTAPFVTRLPLVVAAHSTMRATVWVPFPHLKVTRAQRKKGFNPPLGIAEWRTRDGAPLARNELLGVPLGGVIEVDGDDDPGDAPEMAEGSRMFLILDQRGWSGDEVLDDYTSLIGHLGQAANASHAAATVTLDRFPRLAAGLAAFKAVVLEGFDPDALDRAQRQALLEYLRGGGTAVVCAPVAAVGRAAGWFDEHFPVRLVGTRVAREIQTSQAGGTILTFRKPATIVEAQEGRGRVLLRDRDYVHVAEQPVGLGKVVFTSFPVNALSEPQSQVAVLWEQLLSLERPQWEWRRTRLAAARHDVLGAMIGQRVAPWGVAAGVAGGYLAVILLAQGIFLGPSRPKAFAAAVAVALLLSGGLLVMGMTRNRDGALQSARLAVLDVSPTGGGWRQESAAFVGIDDPKMPLRTTGEQVFLRPALADPGNPPAVRQQPFAVDQAGVFSQRIERVWEAAAPVDVTQRLSATASFAAGGLTLDIENNMGARLESPLLVWRGRALAMEDVSEGTSKVAALRSNALGDFTSAGVLASDQAKRRGRVVGASLASPNALLSKPEPGHKVPQLVGWLPDGAGNPLLAPAAREVVAGKSMVMVRTPVQIAPPPSGAKLMIPGALVEMNMGRMPYELDKGESVPSQQPGEWLVSFAAPVELGRVKPTRVALDVRVTLPEHALSIHKNQCVGGVGPKINRGADPLAEWSRHVGPQRLEFTCEPGDYDKDGRVWLLLDVRPAGGAGGAGAVAWQLQGLDVSIEAEAVAPPEPIRLDAPPPRLVREEEVQ